MAPLIDVNLFVHDGAGTLQAAIDSVRAQAWTNWRMVVIDDGSTDGSAEIAAAAAAEDARIMVRRLRCNVGAVGAFQRGLWQGDADYVMPKSADDLIAPEFMATLMAVLEAHPQCAMAHAGGLSFVADGRLQYAYPPEHNLHAVGADARARAGAVMCAYTSSPSFWGVYRRTALDRLAPIAPRAGWDHVLLAELALYGEVRHVPEALYWRRGGGRPIGVLARAATREAARGIDLAEPGTDLLWVAPCITTAFAHVENFAVAPLPVAEREALMEDAGRIFRARWQPRMHDEVQAVRAAVRHAARPGAGVLGRMAALQVARLLTAVACVLPEAELQAEWRMLHDMGAGAVPCWM